MATKIRIFVNEDHDVFTIESLLESPDFLYSERIAVEDHLEEYISDELLADIKEAYLTEYPERDERDFEYEELTELCEKYFPFEFERISETISVDYEDEIFGSFYIYDIDVDTNEVTAIDV